MQKDVAELQKKIDDTAADLVLSLAFVLEPGTDVRKEITPKLLAYTEAVKALVRAEFTPMPEERTPAKHHMRTCASRVGGKCDCGGCPCTL